MAKNPDIEEMLKKGLLKRGSDPSLVIRRTTSGLEGLDFLLGGGVPKGKIIELYGPESTGKTLICQTIAAAIQKTEMPDVVYFDMEDSFDQEWWAQSDVDLSKMYVTNPTTAEQAIDLMVMLLQAQNLKIGLMIVDSIAGMVPAIDADPDRSADEKTMGAQAKVVTLMFHKVKSLLGDTIWLLTNQMRSTLGTSWDEISALPGGKANRHYCHAILRTHRSSWIKEGETRVGFNMQIINKKNKLAKTAEGESVDIPFTYVGQIDFLMSYIDEGIEKDVITRGGPWFQFKDQKWLGRPAMREWFLNNPEMIEELKVAVYEPVMN